MPLVAMVEDQRVKSECVMNDEEEIPKILKITSDQIADFFADKSISAECPSCGQNNWNTCTEISGDIPVLFSLSDTLDLRLGPNAIPLIALICNNCGFVRSHARQVIYDWLIASSAKEKQ